MIDEIRVKAAEIENWLWDVAVNVYDIKRCEESRQRIGITLIRERWPEKEQVDGATIASIECVELAWGVLFAHIAQLEDSKPIEALHFLTKAAEEKGFVFSLMESRNFPDGRANIKAMAAGMAKRRHAENYSMIDDALKHWRANIDPNLSASKAANELVRIVPLSHKKLAEVVSAEKKKQH